MDPPAAPIPDATLFPLRLSTGISLGHRAAWWDLTLELLQTLHRWIEWFAKPLIADTRMTCWTVYFFPVPFMEKVIE